MTYSNQTHFLLIPASDPKTPGEMTPLNIECEPGEVSDGFHSFSELYTHRYLLFCALSQTLNMSLYSWKSRRHWIEGKTEPVWPGWFVAGIDLWGDNITYHLPVEYWDSFRGIVREEPPPFDGHTSQDVIERLMRWLQRTQP